MVAQNTEFDTNEVGPSPEFAIKNGQPILFVVFGRLTYEELSGPVHHTGFAIEVSPHIAAFSRIRTEYTTTTTEPSLLAAECPASFAIFTAMRRASSRAA
jgi:hypothetical protein